MQKAIRSNRVVTPEGVRPACVLFEFGRIAGVEAYGIGTDLDVIDVGDSYVLRGNKKRGRERSNLLNRSPFSCQPVTSTVRLLNSRRDAMAGKCFVDYSFWAAAVSGNVDELFSLALAGVPGFACVLAPSGPHRSETVTEGDLQRLMPVIAKTGLPLLVYNGAQSIQLLIDLCAKFDCRVHIVQPATEEALQMLESARSKKLALTVDIVPGEAGISVVWTEAEKRGFTMADVVRWMCEKPAELAGLQSRKGHIAPGFDADLVVFDSEVKMTFLGGEKIFHEGQFAEDPLGTDCMIS